MDDMRQLTEAMIIMSRPVFARAAEELSASPQLAVVWAHSKTGVIMHKCLTAEMADQRARWPGACFLLDCCGRCLMKSHPSDAAVKGASCAIRGDSFNPSRHARCRDLPREDVRALPDAVNVPSSTKRGRELATMFVQSSQLLSDPSFGTVGNMFHSVEKICWAWWVHV